MSQPHLTMKSRSNSNNKYKRRVYIRNPVYSRNDSYRRNFSELSTKEARDNASFTVQSQFARADFRYGTFRLWDQFRLSDAFTAVQRMFQQVSIQGVSIYMSLSNVTPNSTNTKSEGSVAALYAWDRDGVLSTEQFNILSGEETDIEKQSSMYDSLSRISSAYLTNIGITTATRVVGTNIWANSMQEKSLYISTDMLQQGFTGSNADNSVLGNASNQWNNQTEARIVAWNPALLVALQSGYKCNFRITFKFHVVCKGVRILQIGQGGSPVVPQP